MTIFFNILLTLTIILLILKLIFSFIYFQKINSLEKSKIDESKYTIVQPILSGDPRLEEDLTANLKNTTDMEFIWLVDKSDKIAIQTVEKILKNKNYSNRIEVYYLDDVPQEVNPKIFKLEQVVDKIKTEYTIILDDDSVIDRKRLDELSIYEKDKTEWIATGIPFNYNIRGFYSKLISAFINSNSIFSYFSLSFLKENKTINGMFYILRTDILKKYSAFENIKYWLCDDLALATYLLSKDVKIIQSTIFCNVRNTVPSFKRYILLMKRWLLFSNVYMKNAFSIKFLFIILLPTLLPTILLFLSFYLGINYLVLTLNLFIGKVALFHIIRLFIYQGVREEKTSKKSDFIVFPPQTKELLYELLSEFLLPLMLIYTLLTPPVILWRNKKSELKMGRYIMKFKEYLEKLESLDISKTLLKEGKIVFVISGSSNLKTAALEPDRFEILNIFKEFGYKIIKSNFPYNEDFEHSGFEDINILKASLSNIIYYPHTLFNKRFKKEILRHLEPIKSLKDVIIISLSSGLNVWKKFMDLTNYDNENIKIFALGPVGKGYGKLKNTIVFKGIFDIYSWLLDFHKVDKIVNCGHLGYFKNRKVKEIIYGYLQRKN